MDEKNAIFPGGNVVVLCDKQTVAKENRKKKARIAEEMRLKAGFTA